MPNKEVQTKDGNTKNVIADSQADLDEAVKVAKGESAPSYPNINKPVAKGHDKVEVQDDLTVELKDGTGAHNSPHDAINADGSTEGAWDGSEEPESVQVPQTGNENVPNEQDQPPQAREDSNASSKTSKKK